MDKEAGFQDHLKHLATGIKEKASELIKNEEGGSHTKAYDDGIGIKTIGNGINIDAQKDWLKSKGYSVDALKKGLQKLSPNHSESFLGDHITKGQAALKAKLIHWDEYGDKVKSSLLSAWYNGPSLIGPKLTTFLNTGQNHKAFAELARGYSFKANARGWGPRRLREAVQMAQGLGLKFPGKRDINGYLKMKGLSEMPSSGQEVKDQYRKIMGDMMNIAHWYRENYKKQTPLHKKLRKVERGMLLEPHNFKDKLKSINKLLQKQQETKMEKRAGIIILRDHFMKEAGAGVSLSKMLGGPSTKEAVKGASKSELAKKIFKWLGVGAAAGGTGYGAYKGRNALTNLFASTGDKNEEADGEGMSNGEAAGIGAALGGMGGYTISDAQDQVKNSLTGALLGGGAGMLVKHLTDEPKKKEE